MLQGKTLKPTMTFLCSNSSLYRVIFSKTFSIELFRFVHINKLLAYAKIFQFSTALPMGFMVQAIAL